MQVVANGLVNGLTIALLAIAFSVVYVPTRVFAIALGGIYTSVPYIVWQGLRLGWPWHCAAALGLLVGTGVSVVTELVNHGPLERRRASGGTHLVASLGACILLVSAVALIWGNETKTLRTGLDRCFRLEAVILTGSQVLSLSVALVVLAVFYLWLRLSNLALQFRALADNPVEVALRGYNVNRLRLLAFGISGLLCSISSLLVAYDVAFDPNAGLPALLLGIVATIIGGRGSFAGPLAGGILLGILRSEVVWYSSARWQEAATFALLVVFLFIRPQGILGRRLRLEAVE